jgi:hypothetical protein
VIAKTGHHGVTVDAITLALGAAGRSYADYLDTCRQERNVIDYTRFHVASDSEADEIVTIEHRLRCARKAKEFYGLVQAWSDSKVNRPRGRFVHGSEAAHPLHR